MKRLFFKLVAIMSLLTACKEGSVNSNLFNVETIKEFIESPYEQYYADSIHGYATFSADSMIVVIPKEITKEQYEKLMTDRYTMHPVLVDNNSVLSEELNRVTQQNVIRYMKARDLYEGDFLLEKRGRNKSKANVIYHYPETRQYEFVLFTPLTSESFMMTEDGIIDSTFMYSEISTYGINKIFVGQQGNDCDFHGDLWFYLYDEKNHHMISLCHYVDYRWSEDGGNFNLCWISENELLVSARSTGNSEWGWVGGYKPTRLAPYQTPVYYKLMITFNPKLSN